MIRRTWVVIFALGALQLGSGSARAENVDVLFVNGKVLTVDSHFSIASSVAIRGEKIVAVGGDELARRYQAARKIDLHGRVLMPGFDDTHVHVSGHPKNEVILDEVTSMGELQALVRNKARELGPGKWVTGEGWDEAKFAEKRNPTRADLDSAAPQNPVVLLRAGGHSSVSNSRALEAAGITRATADPPSGVIEHTATGELNGIIRERNDLVTRFVPSVRWDDVRQSYIESLRQLLSLGITSLMEASGALESEASGGQVTPADMAADSDLNLTATYERLRSIYDQQGTELPRIALYIKYPGAALLKAYPHHTGYGDARVRLGPIGESPVDGGFTGPTAWTLADYKGQPGFRGKPSYSMQELQEMVNTSAKLGWQMGLHTIGDAAILHAVDAYSKGLHDVVGPGKDHRWFLDHFVMMPPAATLETMSRDRILIAQQPNFLYTLEGRYEQTLDDRRIEQIVPVRTPVQRGLLVSFGSDNLPIGPMVGLYVAVTRKGQSGKVWGAEEAVSIQDAIRMYTANGPYLTWEEKIKGTLEPGKLADMIVLDSDPLTQPPQKLLSTHVDLTLVGGKIVYERGRDPAAGQRSTQAD
jgi:predicted amidohydrolase YtcJ